MNECLGTTGVEELFIPTPKNILRIIGIVLISFVFSIYFFDYLMKLLGFKEKFINEIRKWRKKNE